MVGCLLHKLKAWRIALLLHLLVSLLLVPNMEECPHLRQDKLKIALVHRSIMDPLPPALLLVALALNTEECPHLEEVHLVALPAHLFHNHNLPSSPQVVPALNMEECPLLEEVHLLLLHVPFPIMALAMVHLLGLRNLPL
jgi:hypothetical protein